MVQAEQLTPDEVFDILELIEEAKTDEEKLELEASLIRQTDNGPKPEDGALIGEQGPEIIDLPEGARITKVTDDNGQ